MYIVQIIKNACYEYIRMNSIHSKIQNHIQDHKERQLQISLRSLENHEIEANLFSNDVEKSFDANSLRCRNSDGRSFPTAGSDS